LDVYSLWFFSFLLFSFRFFLSASWLMRRPEVTPDGLDWSIWRAPGQARQQRLPVGYHIPGDGLALADRDCKYRMAE
jgi:hypothetical protein